MPMLMDFIDRTKVCILVLVCDCVCVYMYIEVHNPNVGLSLFFPNTTATATATTSKLYLFLPTSTTSVSLQSVLHSCVYVSTHVSKDSTSCSRDIRVCHQDRGCSRPRRILEKSLSWHHRLVAGFVPAGCSGIP